MSEKNGHRGKHSNAKLMTEKTHRKYSRGQF